MNSKSIAVVGAFGYGRNTIDEILKNGKENEAHLEAVIDINPSLDEQKEFYTGHGVSTYKTLEEMYGMQTPDIVYIASPIQLHKQQACFAMENGSDVLLEKPIAGCLEDVDELIRVRDKTSRKLLVGFQHIFDDTIMDIKKIVLSRELGALEYIKCIVLWPRKRDYFVRNSWAGKFKDSAGRFIRDSVVNNATAHYIMDILYFVGDEMDRAGNIIESNAKLWRANTIEMFDTCRIDAEFEGGVKMMAIASHATKQKQNAKYLLQFENGQIVCEENEWKIIKDGKEKIIGTSSHGYSKKMCDFIKYCEDDKYPNKCTLECAREHTKLIENIDGTDIKEFSEGVKEQDGFIYIEGLCESLLKQYDEYSG